MFEGQPFYQYDTLENFTVSSSTDSEKVLNFYIIYILIAHSTIHEICVESIHVDIHSSNGLVFEVLILHYKVE